MADERKRDINRLSSQLSRSATAEATQLGMHWNGEELVTVEPSRLAP